MTILRSLLALLLLTSLVACSDDNPTDDGSTDDPNNSTEYKNEATAKINGTDWTATNIIATRNDAGGVTAITFTAFGANDSRISFGMAFGSVKEHTIDGQVVQADFKYEGKSYGEGESGTITITNLTSTECVERSRLTRTQQVANRARQLEVSM
ncbi:MAG: hypothetical protein R3F28_15350 [Candidatus Kapaibacterium sp.]